MESLIVRNVTLMALFYLNLFYLTSKVLKKTGPATFLSILVFLIVIVSFFNSGFHQYFVEGRGLPWERPPIPNDMPPFGPGMGHPPMMFASPTFSSFLITIIVVAASSLLVLWDDWTKAQT